MNCVIYRRFLPFSAVKRVKTVESYPNEKDLPREVNSHRQTSRSKGSEAAGVPHHLCSMDLIFYDRDFTRKPVQYGRPRRVRT